VAAFYGLRKLKHPDDWKGLAGGWKPKRSAYELAHTWQLANGLPTPIYLALNTSGHAVLHNIKLDRCFVEMPVFLESRRAPSVTDIMCYGRNADKECIVMAVEGKASEPFAERVSWWLRGEASDCPLTLVVRPSRRRRLDFLGQHLRMTIGDGSRLRYQLMHRTVSAILQAKLHGAAAAVVVVHTFGEHGVDNWNDYCEFLRGLGADPSTPMVVVGPRDLGHGFDVPTYFLWWPDSCYVAPGQEVTQPPTVHGK